jgi:hypothetical protein
MTIERLQGVGLAEGDSLTVAGALYLLPDPSHALGKAFSEVMRYPDDTTVDYDRREEVRGPLHHVLEAAAGRGDVERVGGRPGRCRPAAPRRPRNRAGDGEAVAPAPRLAAVLGLDPERDGARADPPVPVTTARRRRSSATRSGSRHCWVQPAGRGV